jgi:hypothetical protein
MQVYHFKLYKDAEKIFYNLDNIATENTLIIRRGVWYSSL